MPYGKSIERGNENARCGRDTQRPCQARSYQNDYMLEAFKIAVENKITIYDALFIELAKSTNNELVTSDSKQAEVASKEGVKIKIL